MGKDELNHFQNFPSLIHKSIPNISQTFDAEFLCFEETSGSLPAAQTGLYKTLC